MRSLLLALFCFSTSVAGARAEGWRVQSAEGDARLFSAGAWSAAEAGAALPSGAIVETGTGGQVLLLRDRDSVDLAAEAKIKVEGDDAADTTLRAFSGVVGINESAAKGKRFVVLTTLASAVAQGAAFGVSADSQATTITVTRGVVSVTDMARRGTMDVGPGQTVRVKLGGAVTLLAPAETDAAVAAAHEAAAKLSTADSTQPSPGDARALGALKSDAKSGDGAKAVDRATAELHEMKGKAKLGKGDPKTVAAVGRMAEELTQGIEVETDPWNDDFKWTEVEQGELRLKPIHRVVLGLTGPEALQFWTLTLLISVLFGLVANAVMKDAGLGTVMNAGLIFLAFVVAVLIRDAFFRAQGYIADEPFLSVGMMIAAMPLLLLGAAAAKMRLDL